MNGSANFNASHPSSSSTVNGLPSINGAYATNGVSPSHSPPRSNGIQSSGIQSSGIQSNGNQSTGIQSSGIQSSGIQSNGSQGTNGHSASNGTYSVDVNSLKPVRKGTAPIDIPMSNGAKVVNGISQRTSPEMNGNVKFGALPDVFGSPTMTDTSPSMGMTSVNGISAIRKLSSGHARAGMNGVRSTEWI